MDCSVSEGRCVSFVDESVNFGYGISFHDLISDMFGVHISAAKLNRNNAMNAYIQLRDMLFTKGQDEPSIFRV